jgi:hypothetical protein
MSEVHFGVFSWRNNYGMETTYYTDKFQKTADNPDRKHFSEKKLGPKDRTRYLLFFMLFFFLHYFALGQVKKNIPAFNPTGTYKLNHKTYTKDGDTFGYFGSIRVKLINTRTIAVSLFVCAGAPSYNQGAFVDTLIYSNHRALYHHADGDTSCRITLYFTAKGVSVKQIQADLNCGCDFGHAVLADWYYKKVSGKFPVIRNEEL